MGLKVAPRCGTQVAAAHTLTATELHRFLREGRAAAQLRHPNIAAIHETGFDGGVAYIASDLVPGLNLREYIATTPLDFKKTAEICAGIAEALQHAHERGVVHRDLKPANIILDASGQPHVIDFGLAKLASEDAELTSDGELLGTLTYMSPEQARRWGQSESRDGHLCARCGVVRNAGR